MNAIAEITTSFFMPTGDPERITIVWRSSSSGYIICKNHRNIDPAAESNTDWCDHLEYWCKQRQDLDMLIRNNSDEYLVRIPMVPTLDLWEIVTLNRAEFNDKVMVVHWNIFPNTTQFLTHLRVGEGRLAIRESLFQRMLADPLRPKECQAAHHSYAAQMQFEKNMRTNKSFAENWSLWRTLHCLWCNSHDGSGDPDLVPDRERNVWS